MKYLKILLIFSAFFPLTIIAGSPTPSPDKPTAATEIGVKVGDKTKTIKVINTTNDTKVVSKVYKLKHVNPWDIKPILEAAVGAKRNNRSSTGVECIKYNDGSGAVIVSAEMYRFSKDQGGGMSIDELVESLDQPRGKIIDGMETFIYYPKYRNAKALARMLNEVGLQVKGDKKELLSGESKAVADKQLNAVIIYATPSELKNVKKLLGVYDQGINQITLKYKIYELSHKNVEEIGNDYLAWKNGPGAGLFTIGGRFRNAGKTKFVKFNKKWNSSFIDFLVEKKKATELTSGFAVLKNRKRYSNLHSKPTVIEKHNGFGILVIPSIHKKSTTLDMKLSYISEINTSSLNTKVQILNDGGKVIVGGLEKSSKINSSASPGFLDWLLGGSSAAIKKTQLVIILEATPDSPDSGIPPEAKKVIDEVKKELGID